MDHQLAKNCLPLLPTPIVSFSWRFFLLFSFTQQSFLLVFYYMVAYNCLDLAKAKIFMDTSLQDLIKSIAASIAALYARMQIVEITIKANTDASIKASEERLTKKIDTKVADYEERITILEKQVALPHKN